MKVLSSLNRLRVAPSRKQGTGHENSPTRELRPPKSVAENEKSAAKQAKPETAA